MSRIAGLSAAVFVFLVATIWFAFPTDAFDKSKKKAIETVDAPKAIGPYSQAIVAGDLIFVSGQIGLDPKTGTIVEGGVEAETEQVLKNLEAVLKASNSDFDSVVKSTIFLADIGDFAKVNEIYARKFKAPFPARATVQAAKLPRDAKIEIELTALVKK
ncbi:MAG: RidA family protein [Acidobacteria bacterium]|nr:RidA family protein [Acidobacteriota bacterium]